MVRHVMIIFSIKNAPYYRIDFALTRYLKKQFQKADKNKNGSLTFDECLGLTEQLNIQMDKKRLIELFQVIKSINYRYVNGQIFYPVFRPLVIY